MLEDELLKNLRRIVRSAGVVYVDKDYTSATVLYFKALFVALDIILLKSIGKTPKDHTERFRMLEQNNPKLYQFLDKLFSTYRDTYSTSVDEETCKEIREHVIQIIKDKNLDKAK